MTTPLKGSEGKSSGLETSYNLTLDLSWIFASLKNQDVPSCSPADG